MKEPLWYVDHPQQLQSLRTVVLKTLLHLCNTMKRLQCVCWHNFPVDLGIFCCCWVYNPLVLLLIFMLKSGQNCLREFQKQLLFLLRPISVSWSQWLVRGAVWFVFVFICGAPVNPRVVYCGVCGKSLVFTENGFVFGTACQWSPSCKIWIRAWKWVLSMGFICVKKT